MLKLKSPNFSDNLLSVKNSIKISLVYIGIIIGAGFASGQEILQFFNTNNPKSIIGIIVCAFLFGLISFCVLSIILRTKVTSTTQFFNDGTFATIINWLIIGFMICSYVAMVSASGAIFKEYFNFPQILGVGIFSAFCLIIFLFNARGIIILNSILTPIMIIGVLLLGVYKLSTAAVPTMASMQMIHQNWLISSIVYASYNVLTCVSVMTALRAYIINLRTVIISSIISFIVLLGLLLTMWLMLKTSTGNLGEIPMLTVLHSLRNFYLPLLYIAMLTTATSNGFGVIHSLPINSKISAIVIALIGVILGMLPFSGIVAIAYSMFGVLGLGVMGYILYKQIFGSLSPKNSK